LIAENGYFLEEREEDIGKEHGRHALIDKHVKKALKLFALSAHQNHKPSMYMLSLIHIEGHEHYSSCSLGSSLLSEVIQLKNSQFYSQQVDKFFDG
jgi:TPR repeat protein